MSDITNAEIAGLTWDDIESKVKIGPKELRALLGVHPQTVLRWRRQRQGPPSHKEVGRVWYYVEDLKRWRARTKWAQGRECF